MKYPLVQNYIGKAVALVVATLILPALAFAGTDNGKGNDGQDNGKQSGRYHFKGNGGEDNEKQNHRDHFPVVPEVNVGWVLVPFVGAVLFFSARQLFRGKATR